MSDTSGPHGDEAVTAPSSAGAGGSSSNESWLLEFALIALRRGPIQDDERATLRSVALGAGLARLVAEAPAGCAVEVRTRAAGQHLRVRVLVGAPASASRAVTRVADEVAAMLALAYRP